MGRMLVYLNKNSNTVIMLYYVVENNRNINNSLCNREILVAYDRQQMHAYNLWII